MDIIIKDKEISQSDLITISTIIQNKEDYVFKTNRDKNKIIYENKNESLIYNGKFKLLNSKDFKIQKQLKLFNKGGCASIFLAKYFNTKVVLKKSDDYGKRYFINEHFNLEHIGNNQHLAKYFGMVVIRGVQYLVFNLEKYSLRQFLIYNQNKQELIKSPGKLIRLCINIGKGIQFLHSIGVVHIDLHPSNILIGKYLKPLIHDFGFSKILNQDQDFIKEVGCQIYQSPEVLKYGRNCYDFLDDIYSFGLIIVEIFKLGKEGAKIPYFIKEVISKCLKSKEKRSNINEIVKDLIRLLEKYYKKNL